MKIYTTRRVLSKVLKIAIITLYNERKDMIEMAINQNEKVKRAKEECEYLQGD